MVTETQEEQQVESNFSSSREALKEMETYSNPYVKDRQIGDVSGEDEGLSLFEHFSFVLFSYFLPVLLFISYAAYQLPSELSWSLVSLGLLLVCFGSLLLLFGLAKRSVTRVVVREVLSPSSEVTAVEEVRVTEEHLEFDRLQEAFQLKEQELELLREENRQLLESSQKKGEEGDREQEWEERLKRKEALLSEYQQTISEQRGIIERKQQYAWKLENKIQDLKYEVETLLQIQESGTSSSLSSSKGETGHPVIDLFGEESEADRVKERYGELPISSDRQIHNPYDAALELRKCIEVATQLTGSSPLGGPGSRFLSLSSDNHAIDLRQLFDRLRSESATAVLVYSPKEEKLLFANHHVRTLLGWSPEKFAKDFAQLIENSWAEWRHSIKQLEKHREVQVRLMVKAKSGREILIHCYLGAIPSGAFKDQVVAVLYSDS